MIRNRTSLVALLAASSIFLVSEAWATKPIAPEKKQGQKQDGQVPGKGKTPQAGTPQPQKVSKGAAEAEDATTALPRALNPAALASKTVVGDGERIVITNDDLQRIYGKSKAKTVEPDYGRFLSEVERQESVRQRKIRGRAMQGKNREARAKKLRQDIDRLKKKLLGIRNPLLPRGKSTKDEAKREKGWDNAQRAAATKAELARLEAELLKLQ